MGLRLGPSVACYRGALNWNNLYGDGGIEDRKERNKKQEKSFCPVMTATCTRRRISNVLVQLWATMIIENPFTEPLAPSAKIEWEKHKATSRGSVGTRTTSSEPGPIPKVIIGFSVFNDLSNIF